MAESGPWGSSRFIAVLVVLALHLAVVLLLLTAPGAPPMIAADSPLELVFIPPTKAPKMLADSARPKHLRVDVGISVAPPDLDGLAPAAPATQADGAGPGVNWAAEARRALMAYEIRRDQGVEHTNLGLTPWDGWLPDRQRRPGASMRTESGDWIVWINGSCYQIASWHHGAPAREAAKPPTLCIDERGMARAVPGDGTSEQTTAASPP
ncbi:MAG TPA: hypothetical protein VHY75_05175 [Steroidobacteraceae bacterium]|jgi:hypothetical protein|nr:hypothetical protein [Steroidobacteraceae bacterium]